MLGRFMENQRLVPMYELSSAGLTSWPAVVTISVSLILLAFWLTSCLGGTC